MEINGLKQHLIQILVVLNIEIDWFFQGMYNKTTLLTINTTIS